MTPRVSVIMPMYNAAEYAGEAISSILSQTCTDFELIVVDDASTDASCEVVAGFDDSRIRLYRNETNLGTAKNGNRCLELCEGEYIVRMDADDVSEKNRMELQVGFMDLHPEIGLSSGTIHLFGKETEQWKLPTENDDIRAQMIFTSGVAQSASIIRRSVMVDHDLKYDVDGPVVGEDWLLWTRMMQVCKIGNLDEVLLHYRIADANVTRQAENTKWEVQKLLLKGILDNYKIMASEEQLEWHNMARSSFHRKPVAEDVAGIHQWLAHLLKENNNGKISSDTALKSKIDSLWDRLFYTLVPFGKEVIDSYIGVSGEMDSTKKNYLKKYRVNKWLGF